METRKRKGKSKAVPQHAYEAQGEREEYSSYSFTTSALDVGVSGERYAPPALYPRGKGPRAGLDTEAREKNPLPLPGIEPGSPGPGPN